tara:strand:- start:319 stop:480 length:162 start_codon:yes stop_codon:yes gene_type:complete
MDKEQELKAALEALDACLRELNDWNCGHQPSEGQELAREILEKKHAKKEGETA